MIIFFGVHSTITNVFI